MGVSWITAMFMHGSWDHILSFVQDSSSCVRLPKRSE